MYLYVGLSVACELAVAYVYILYLYLCVSVWMCLYWSGLYCVCVQCKEIEEKLNVYRRRAGRSLVNIPDSVGGE